MESDKFKREEKKQMKLLLIFDYLKNDYFLQKLFNFLERGKTLNMVKYNKKIKKRININIIDYKNYSELIEIEIKPVKNKIGQFINIGNEEKLYYHIYFDNCKEEIKRNYINKDENINIIKINIDNKIKSFKNLFKNCKCIESIYFKKFYRNDINNMKNMFYECSSLKELNLDNFNTNNVNRMTCMFYECPGELIMKIKTKYRNIIKYGAFNAPHIIRLFNK